jgi:hypothetical protein
LYSKKGLGTFDASWSHAGDVILFCVGAFFRAPGMPAAQIATIKPDGSDFRAIVDDGFNNGFPGWSPGGKQIAYRRGTRFVVRNLADGATIRLTDGSHYDNFRKWSPDGTAGTMLLSVPSQFLEQLTGHPEVIHPGAPQIKNRASKRAASLAKSAGMKAGLRHR